MPLPCVYQRPVRWLYRRRKWQHRLLPYLPVEIQVEPAAECNLRCSMCALRCYDPPSRPARMELETFVNVIGQFRCLEDVTLQGLGEPLLCKDIFSMVRLVKKRGAKAGFNTNGMLMDTDAAREAMESGLDWLCVSLDAADPSLIAKIRVGADSSRILDNLSTVVEMRKRLGLSNPELTITAVLMRSNIQELPGIVALAYRLGVANVSVQALSHTLAGAGLPERYGPVRDFVATELITPDDATAVEEAYAEARSIADARGVNLRLPIFRTQGTWRPGRRSPVCRWPWDSTYITYDGTVMPCCLASTPDRASFGNLLDQGFGAIWNGPRYGSFRVALASRNVPAVCEGCAIMRGEF